MDLKQTDFVHSGFWFFFHTGSVADVEKLLLTPKGKTEWEKARKPVKEQNRAEAMEAILNQLEKQSLKGNTYTITLKITLNLEFCFSSQLWLYFALLFFYFLYKGSFCSRFKYTS